MASDALYRLGHSLASFSDLPDEVIIYILDLAQSAWKRASNPLNYISWLCQTIPLLSRRVYFLSQPLVFKDLLCGAPDGLRMLAALVSTKRKISSYPRRLDLRYIQDYTWETTSSDLETIVRCCPAITEVYLSPNINFALSRQVLSLLFNSKKIKTLDLSGVIAPRDFELPDDGIHADSIGLFDTSESSKVLTKITPNLRKLDLYNHNGILSQMPVFLGLTHLSLGSCSLRKTDMFEFFTKQDQLRYTLKWLNLELNWSVFMTEDDVLRILNLLVPGANSTVVLPASSIHNSSENLAEMYMDHHNSTLKYLNLNGRCSNGRILRFLRANFVSLEALHIMDSQASLGDIALYLLTNLSLKYINLANLGGLSEGLSQLCLGGVFCVEMSIYEARKLGWKVEIEGQLWLVATTPYRAWLFKESSIRGKNGLTMKTQDGPAMIWHPFLKYASNKIELGSSDWLEAMRDDCVYSRMGIYGMGSL